MEELVLYFSLKYEGDFQSIYNALMRKEQVDEKLRCELICLVLLWRFILSERKMYWCCWNA